MVDFPPLFEGQPVPDSSWFRALANEARKRRNLSVRPPLVMTRTSGGLFVALAEVAQFPAILTQQQHAAYSWSEVRRSGTTWVVVVGGRTGVLNGFEENNALDVPTNTVVWMRLSNVGDYRFVFLRQGGRIDNPKCKGPFCVTVNSCLNCANQISSCPLPAGYITITITDPNGVVIATGPNNSNGQLCVFPPSSSGSGTYTVTFSNLKCSNYLAPAPVTVVYRCDGGAYVITSITQNSALWV